MELKGSVSEGSDLDIADISTAETSGSAPEDRGKDITGRQKNHVAPLVETVEWTENFSPITIEPFAQETGPILPDDWDTSKSHQGITSASSWSPSLIANMVRHTNSNAQWKMAQRAAREGLDSYVEPHWKEVESGMRVFLGLQVFMGVSELPRYELPRSKYLFIGNESFKTAMARNRYKKLREYFHVSDRKSD